MTARGAAYDLVYNGSELGSGSIRIHDAGLQRRIFRVLGLTDEEIERKFGFLLQALASGAPPHGGIALGMDRIVQRFAKVGSLRDVIAFPKTGAGEAGRAGRTAHRRSPAGGAGPLRQPTPTRKAHARNPRHHG